MHWSEAAEGRDALRGALAWLAHPVCVAGLVILLLNDHVLKAEFGSWWTGKLSDVAGLVFAPALVAVVVAALAPRLRPGVVAAASLATVGLLFTLVKATAIGATTASAVWTAVAGPSVVRQDATDLLALPVLVLAWWAFTHARAVTHARTLARARALILVPLATLAVAATSSPSGQSVFQVAEWDGQVYVGVTMGEEYEGAGDDEIRWASSSDGRHFRWLTPAENESFPPPGLITRATEDCVADDPNVCYRNSAVVWGVDQTLDGGETWYVVWPEKGTVPITPDSRLPYLGEGENASDGALVVFESDDGYFVVVGNGTNSLVARFPDETWHEAQSWLHDTPESIPPPKGAIPTPVPQGIVWGVFLALMSFLSLAVVPPHGIKRHSPAWFSGTATAALGVAFFFWMVIYPFTGKDFGWDVFAIENTAVENRPFALGFLVAGSAFLGYGASLLSRLPDRYIGKAIAWSCLGGLAAGVIATVLYRSEWSPWVPAVAGVVTAVVVIVIARRRMATSAAKAAVDNPHPFPESG
ncbi:MAG: hypothetical protein JW722_00090 [Demequinaceae bacterium]|nr:hypothetical protein [Demequinaceae bacterium]